MKNIIKIDRKSIVKNPNAGNTSTRVMLNQQTSFEYDLITYDNFCLLQQLQNERRLYITEYTDFYSVENYLETKISCKGEILDHSLIDSLPKKGLKINTKINWQTINHLPECEYTYHYKNTLVECSNCLGLVYHQSISEQYDDNYEYKYKTCPICNGIDTFDYSFEDINSIKIK